jgi:hypothetical protein
MRIKSDTFGCPKPEKKANKKKASLSTLDAKAWKLCSEYVRRRGADENGYVACFTCSKVFRWQDLHAGHFQRRRHKATKFHEMNIQPQCISCNTFQDGEQFIFGRNLDKKYGAGMADMLAELAKKEHKITRDDYEYMIRDFTEKIEALCEKNTQ